MGNSETMSPDDARLYERGAVTWHSSGPDEGPDVGISIGLGGGKMLWIGEITRRSFDDAGPDAAELGNDFGTWLILYGQHETTVIGKCVNSEVAQELSDELAAAFRRPSPTVPGSGRD